MEQYPLFKQEHLKEVEDNLFQPFLNFTDLLVHQVQYSTTTTEEIPLTFYPIAKNIRIPASYMTLNVLNQKKSVLGNSARVGEELFWKSKNKDEWFPWLWARGRIDGNYTNKEGWSLYFDSFTEREKQLDPIVEAIQPPPELLLFFTYLSCIKYTFQLNEVYRAKMEEYRAQMQWPDRVLAVQIRRGDTCTKDGSVTDRPFFHLSQYIEKIDAMSFDHVYVSTDSDEEIDELKRLRPNLTFLSLPLDRSQFFRMEETPVNIEVFCSREPSRIPFIVDSGLADLYFISQCQGYISTVSVSEFSRCGWFLQIATQRKITPYVNMNDEPLNMELRDKLLLL